MIQYDHQDCSRGCDANGDRESLQTGIKTDEIVFNERINWYHTAYPLSFLICVSFVLLLQIPSFKL